MSNICPTCGRSWWRYVDECYCGFNFKKDSKLIRSEVAITEKIDSILTWSRKATKKMIAEGVPCDENGRVNYYHNLSTGEQGYSLADVMTERGYRLYQKKSKGMAGIYVGEDTKNGYLVFIRASLNTETPVKGDIRQWQEEVRMYVTKDRKLLNPITQWAKTTYGYVERPVVKDRYVELGFRNLSTAMDIIKTGYINETSNEDFSDFTETIKNFVPNDGIVNLTGNKMIHVNDPITFSEYMKKFKEIKGRKGPKQDKVDELTKVELGEVKKPSVLNKANLDVKTFSYLASNVDTFATLEKVEGIENTCVIRTFSAIPDTDTMLEGYRMYVQGKQVYTCKKGEDGKFIFCPLYMNPKNWDFSLAEFEKDVAKGTILEYFASVIDEIPHFLRSKAIWAFIKWPLLEQLYKAGYRNITLWILLNSVKKSPKEVLELAFGVLSEGKNMYQKLGVNKYQLDYIEKNIGCLRALRTEYYESVIEGAVIFIKSCLKDDTIARRSYWREKDKNPKTIADIDNETFELYAKAFCDVYDKTGFPIDDLSKTLFISYDDIRNDESKKYWTAVPRRIQGLQCAIKLLRSFYSPQMAINITPNLVEISDKFIETTYRGYNGNQYTSRQDPIEYYYDYLHMAYTLNDNVNYRPQFDDIEQIKNMHDMISEVINMNRDKVKHEAFMREIKKCNKWKWAPEDEDYIVIAPKAPSDLAKEGTALHHCVKGYIGRVADGITNIMFIRMKNAPEDPFFTVEISNSGSIEQIHGLCNRNLNTEPKLVPFVNKWIKAAKLKSSNFNKVR